MPNEDLCTYWESIANELCAAKDRVRNLIGSAHWGTDGSHKEILLRKILERHLPEDLSVSTGFVYKGGQVSTQIDILVTNRSGYTLFKDGELLIVTPHAVRAIVEVKTCLRGMTDIKECVGKLAKNGALAEAELVQDRGQVWCGLFVYEGEGSDAEGLLKALSAADASEGCPVDCVAYGSDVFITFHSTGGPHPVWMSHSCGGLAPGCFIMDMIAKLTKNPGVSDFSVLNRPILEGRVVANLQIGRGENTVENV